MKNGKRAVFVIGLTMVLMSVALVLAAAEGKADGEKTSTLKRGRAVNAAIKSLANGAEAGTDTRDAKIKSIQWNEAANGGIEIQESGESVYVSFSEDEGIVYVYSDADIIYANADSSNLFFRMNTVGSLDGIVGHLDTSRVTDMHWMFEECESLESLSLNGWDTSNVTNMSGMFAFCKSLKQLDIGSLDTSNAESMSYMFQRCESITSLELSQFETANVNSMSYMFDRCESLEQLELLNFSTANVTEMRDMFNNCRNLKFLDLSSFDTSNVTSMVEMFSGCSSLQAVDVSSFDTSHVHAMGGMFGSCDSLSELDLSSFDLCGIDGTASMQLVDFMLGKTVGTDAKWDKIVTPQSTVNAMGVSIALPYDDFYEYSNGEYGPTAYSEIPSDLTKSIVLRRKTETDTQPKTEPEKISEEISEEIPDENIPAPPDSSVISAITTGDGSFRLADQRPEAEHSELISATVANGANNLQFVVRSSDGAAIAKLVDVTEGKILEPVDLSLVDAQGNPYTEFGSCTITLPIPAKMDVEKGDVQVVSIQADGSLEKFDTKRITKNGVACAQFTTTHFSPFAILFVPRQAATIKVEAPSNANTGLNLSSNTAAVSNSASNPYRSSSSYSSGDNRFEIVDGASMLKATAAPTPVSAGNISIRNTVVDEERDESARKQNSNVNDMPKTGEQCNIYQLSGSAFCLIGMIMMLSCVPAGKKDRARTGVLNH